MTETTTDTGAVPKLPFARPGAMETLPIYRELRQQGPVVRVTTPTGDPALLVVAYSRRLCRPPPSATSFMNRRRPRRCPMLRCIRLPQGP